MKILLFYKKISYNSKIILLNKLHKVAFLYHSRYDKDYY